MASTNTYPPSPPRGFPESEYAARLQKAQTSMARDGFDLILLTTEPEVRYFTGFHTQFWQSPTRPWFLLIPQSGKPVAVIPGIGAECMGNTWIEDIRTWGSPDPDDEGVSLLASTIIELGGTSAKLGLMMGHESYLRMPLADFEKLKSLLSGQNPKMTIVDANDLIKSLRAVKSELEIDKIRYAAQAASRAFGRVPEIVIPGMSARDVFQTFKHACLKEGVDDVSYLVGDASPGGYNDIISPARERKLETGDVLILDTGCIWDGYFCDFDRNYSVGAPSSAIADAYSRVWEATERGLEICKPGITCAELFHCMNEAMGGSRDDTGSVGRLGHGLGMQLTEHPSHAAFDQTVLEEGSVITLEPGYNFTPDKMMVHEENLVIRKDGPELLSIRASEDIPVIEGF